MSVSRLVELFADFDTARQRVNQMAKLRDDALSAFVAGTKGGTRVPPHAAVIS